MKERVVGIFRSFRSRRNERLDNLIETLKRTEETAKKAEEVIELGSQALPKILKELKKNPPKKTP